MKLIMVIRLTAIVGLTLGSTLWSDVFAFVCESTEAQDLSRKVTINLVDNRTRRALLSMLIAEAYLSPSFGTLNPKERVGVSVTVSYPSGCPYRAPKSNNDKGGRISDINIPEPSENVRIRIFLNGTLVSSKFDEKYLMRLRRSAVEMSGPLSGLKEYVSVDCVNDVNESRKRDAKCSEKRRYVAEPTESSPRIFYDCFRTCIAMTRYRMTLIEYVVPRHLLPDWRKIDVFVREFLDSLQIDRATK